MTNPTIIFSEDGSTTLLSPQFNTTYHSIHGAIQESKHVYIKSGLVHFVNNNPNKENLHILEIGLGSCLNALLTLEWCNKVKRQTVHYHALEKFPVPVSVLLHQNYAEKIECIEQEQVAHIFQSKWEVKNEITSNFRLFKEEIDVNDFCTDEKFDLIYFDAFDPTTQPEMWCKELMLKMAQVINFGGVLVTFSAKGQVRRDLQEVGFEVERIPGPPGKREMLRATFKKK